MAPSAGQDCPPLRVELRLLLTLAGPNVAGTLAETLMTLVDFAIVSQMSRAEQAQAALSSASMIYLSVFAFLLGTMLCVTTVVSQSLGANRLRDCSSYAWQAIWLSGLFGLVGMATVPFMTPLFNWIGHEPAVRAMEIDYTRIRMFSVGIAGAAVGLGHFFNGIHRPIHNAISVILATIINGVCSYVLVLGHWGMPAMGVPGAAVGALAGNVARVLYLLLLMCYGRAAAPYEARQTCRWDSEKMGRLLRIGWPSGTSLLSDIFAWTAFLVFIIGQFGTAHLAATSICWRYTELSFMPAVGIGQSVATLVGRAIGSDRRDLARRRASLGVYLNMLYMGSMAVVFVLFGPSLIAIFSDEQTVISLGAELLIFVAIFQLFDAVAITYANAMRGAGDTLWPAVAGAVLAWGVMIAGGVAIAHYWPGLESRGPWIAAVVYIVGSGIMFWSRWIRGRWEHLDVIGRPIPAATLPTPMMEVEGRLSNDSPRQDS